jgi:hypothetical protein
MSVSAHHEPPTTVGFLFLFLFLFFFILLSLILLYALLHDFLLLNLRSIMVSSYFNFQRR